KSSSLCTTRYARPPRPGLRNYKRPDAEKHMSSIKPNLPSSTAAVRSSQNSDEIDLGYLLAVCLDNKWMILVVTAIVTLLGAGYAWLATPEYRADALLQVENTQSNLGLEMMVMGQESAG